LSISTCCPSAPDSALAIWRAIASTPPPGANGTIRRIGLLGHASPCAAPVCGAYRATPMMIEAASVLRHVRLRAAHLSFIPVSLVLRDA
jgi:hypothetical protein